MLWRFCAILVPLLILADVSNAQEPPIPNLSEWENSMLTWGQVYCEWFDEQHTFDERLGATYYDAEYVFHQIADYVTTHPSMSPGASYWRACAQKAEVAYRDDYVIPNDAHLPSYWVFTEGLRKDWEVTADATSKSWAITISENAAYCTVNHTALTETYLSREAAYCLEALLNAEALGESEAAHRDTMVGYVSSHLDHMLITRDFRCEEGTCDVPACYGKLYLQPFMAGISARALIKYWEATADDSVISTVKSALDQLWTDSWVSADQAFWYDNCKQNVGDAWPVKSGAEDLNQLIAPAYQWLYERGQGSTYQDKADDIFSGGVLFADQNGYGGPKQFNQNYVWSFKYVEWREGAAAGELPHLRAPAISFSDTKASFTVGVPGVPYESNCTATVKTFPGGATVETITSTEGLAIRRLDMTEALSASTTYTVEQSCEGAEADTQLYSFTTKAAPAGGDRTVTIQAAAPATISGIERCSVTYDDNAALSTPVVERDTSCSAGDTITLTIPAGVYFWQWAWEDASNNPLGKGTVQRLLVE